MVDINQSKTIAERLQEASKVRARTDSYISKNGSLPDITPNMVRGVSAERREMLEMQMEAGQFKNQNYSGSRRYDETDQIRMIQTQAGVVQGGAMYKTANTGSGVLSGTGGWRGSNDTVRQMPEVYSPLWLNSNLSLPRDRATINAWCRAFFALNPIVHNAITLHSTYPIAKLNIKCKNPKVEKFFQQMIEEIDLMNVCVMLAQEYWTVGETFVFGELDEAKGRWRRLTILNPDYVNVQRSVAGADSIISLRPDENLKRIVFGNKPSDLQQKAQLDPSLIEHVKRNENIPVNNFYVSHIARKIAPFEARGTGLPVSVFKQLMLFDRLRESKYTQAESMINPLTLVKIGNQDFRPTPVDLENWRNVFECYDDETEVLTNNGFVKFKDVIDFDEANGKIKNTKTKPGIKIGCFNSETEQLEFLNPISAYVNNYSGEMYHFHNNKIDIKVTPDHDLWVSEKEFEYNPTRYSWGNFKKIKAKDLKVNDYKKLRAVANWNGKNIESVFIDNYEIPVSLYMEFLGYLLSEGCCYTDNKSMHTIGYNQTICKHYEKMKTCMTCFAQCLGRGYSNHIRKAEKEHYHDSWLGAISGKDIYNHFTSSIGVNESTYSYEKHVPRWVLDLSKDHLQVLLNSMVDGDGSRTINSDGSVRCEYFTTSKELANNVQEMVFKCGFSSVLGIKKDKRKNRREGYYILWSNNSIGDYPKIYKNTRSSNKLPDNTYNYHSSVDKVNYNGKIWCFTVPTGLFVTRRNGRITIQGNSAQSDKNFKIFTHDAVTVEPIGFGSGIYDTSGDITQLIKEIYIGLMVPSVIMDGSDTTYATGSVALDVLRQRYMQFRQMLTSWLRNKIFSPISQINDFYEYVDGEKTLIVPEIDWNHMSLFDMDSFINNMVNLSQGEGVAKRVSLQTLYRSLGLEYEEEQRKIRYEDIQDAIRMREVAAMGKYSLHELKSLGPTDDIEEVADEPVPGESPYVPGEGTETGSSGGGTGAAGVGPMPGSPPPSPVGSKPKA
jgi:hypothetical protein